MAATDIAKELLAGRPGVRALAGLAPVVPFVMLARMLSAGAIGGAIPAAVARALGASETRRAEGLILHVRVVALGAALGSWLAIALLGAAPFARPGGRGAALEAALDYAAVVFAGCAAHWLRNTPLSGVRGTGDMLMPALTRLLVSAGGIPIAGALSLGWGPFPAPGHAGLAAGQVAAFGIGALAALGWLAAGASGCRCADISAGVARRCPGRSCGSASWPRSPPSGRC